MNFDDLKTMFLKIKTAIKKFIKYCLKTSTAKFIFSFLAAKYIKFVFLTTRWSIDGQQVPNAYISQSKPFLVCFWHGRLFMLACAWVWKKPFYMLSSAHSDGKLISDTVAYFGVKSIFGSTNKQGASALRRVVKQLQAGDVVGITPDGPRGPNQIASDGAATIARLAKVDMIPLTYSISPHIRLKNWDNFMIPLPFGRGIIAWGDPISYNELTSVKDQTQSLNRALDDLQNRVDCLLD